MGGFLLEWYCHSTLKSGSDFSPVLLPTTLEPAEVTINYILYWNNVALDLNRITHSTTRPYNGPPLSAQMAKGFSTFLDPNSQDPAHRLPPTGDASDARNAIYANPNPTIATSTTEIISRLISNATAAFTGLEAISPSYLFVNAVANVILKLLYINPDDESVQQCSYRPVPGQFKFDGDPSNPVRNFPVDPNKSDGPTKGIATFHLPYYGILAKRIAVQMSVKGQSTEHILADPPNDIKHPQDRPEWEDALKDEIRMGGQPAVNETKCRPDQRAEVTNADFARLFALVNSAMADAGIFAWNRSGIRETENPLADPFFLSYGAPDTNSNRISLKPPFPSCPSGHATFGGAVFHMMRLHYKKRDCLDFEDDAPDTIAFQITSDELNGINRDLLQPYDHSKPIEQQPGILRTLRPRSFSSLWAAIFENAVSRIWLGVHWRFDAFAAKDINTPSTDPQKELYATNEDGASAYLLVNDIRYKTVLSSGSLRLGWHKGPTPLYRALQI
ncbi:phosphatidic acid phosphatase type 2/haloperoxidase [Leptodontidium sp. 2 PMI_412]|nr:phosphatidic acid phosphatase type 2/haloperoxidase [Leptodontidium sp. 2 PMI_412]